MPSTVMELPADGIDYAQYRTAENGLCHRSCRMVK